MVAESRHEVSTWVKITEIICNFNVFKRIRKSHRHKCNFLISSSCYWSFDDMHEIFVHVDHVQTILINSML